jgi:hypothetical protein
MQMVTSFRYKVEEVCEILCVRQHQFDTHFEPRTQRSVFQARLTLL